MTSGTGIGIRRLVVGHALFALVILGISGLVAWKAVPGVLEGEMVGPDNYMRLLRVERLLETGDWYDADSPRSNAPYGETLHWTRPLDLLIAGGALPLRAFLPVRPAVFVSGFLVSPILLILICFAVAALVRDLVETRYQYYAMIAVLAQLGVVGYAVPGRPDHHPLILLLFVIAVTLGARTLGDRGPRSTALATGAVFGVGLWVGPEFLLPLALFVITVAGLWALSSERSGPNVEWFGVGLVTSLALAIVAERAPGDWSAVEYDRLSVVHLWMGILVLGYVFALRQIGPRAGNRASTRLGVALGLGAVALATMALTFPKFFGGPTVDVDPILVRTWLVFVEEYQSFPIVDTVAGFGYLIAFLGAAAVCIPFTAWLVFGSGERENRSAWVLIGLFLVALVPLSVVRFRFAPYPELLAVPALMALLSRVRHRIPERLGDPTRAALRSGAAALVITGPLLVGAVMVSADGSSSRVVREAQARTSRACSVSDIAPVLNDPDGLGSRSRTVLAHLDMGPEILYRTPHRVLGTPYHRNAEGILGGRRILREPFGPSTLEQIRDRAVEIILHCPEAPALPPASQAASRGETSGSAPALYVLLETGTQPDWIRRVPVPEGQDGNFLLFEVVPPS